MRNKIKLLLPSFALGLISGCSAVGVHLYEGEKIARSDLVAFRVTSPGLMVKEVDGKPVTNFWNDGRVSHAYIPPGKHTFKLYTFKDAYWTLSSSGYKYTYADVDLETLAGHTYIFHVKQEEDGAKFYHEDKGVNYNPECLNPLAWGNVPLRKKVIVEDC